MAHMNTVGTQTPSMTRVVVTVHGIRTFGQWQERLGELLRTSGFEGPILHFKYGYFSSLAFLVPPLRFLIVLRFARYLKLLQGQYPGAMISFVAHSFGTHLVGWALRRISHKTRFPAEVIVLAGSVLKPTFRWNDLISRGSARIVLNECGTKDGILVLNQLVALGTGMAGRLGFIGLLDENFVNNYFNFGHSGYFVRNGAPYDAFMQQRWVPLLRAQVLPPRVDERQRGGVFTGLMTWLLQNSEPVKLAFYLSPLIAITVLSLYLYVGAVARQLAAEAINVENETPDVAMLLAVESSRLRHTANTESALLSVLQVDPAFSRFLFRPPDDLADMAYNHLGSAVAVSDHSGCIYLYDASTGRQTDNLCLPAEAFAESLAFTVDDQRLLIGGADGGLSIWNVKQRRFEAERVKAHEYEGDEPTFFLPLPDGHRALSTGGDSVLKLWSIAPPLKFLKSVSVDVDPFSTVIHPDGCHVFLGGSDGEISEWDLCPFLHPIRKIHPHREIVSIGLNRQGTILASTDRTEPYLRLWDATSLNEMHKPLTLPRSGGTGVAFSPKNDQIVVSNAFETISLFEDPAGVESVQLRGVNVPFALSPDGINMAAGMQDRESTVLLNLKSSRSIARYLPTYDRADILQLGLSTNGQTLAVVHSDGNLYVEDVESGKVVFQKQLSGGPFAPFAASDRDTRLVREIPLPTFGPTVVFSRDTRFMAASLEKKVCIYETYRAVEAHCIDIGFTVKSLAFNGSGELLAIGGNEGQLTTMSKQISSAKIQFVNRTTSPASLSERGDLTGSAISIDSLAYSSDERFILVGGSDGEVDYINIKAPNPEIITRFTGHSNAVFGVCFDQRSDKLISASSDGTLRLWKIGTQAELGLPIRTATGMQVLACSSDWSYVFSVARKNVYVYNPGSNAIIAVLQGPKDFMRSLTVSGDGQILVGASQDEIVVWDLRPESLRQRACEISNRNLTVQEWKQYVSTEIPCRRVCPSTGDSPACTD